MRAHIISKIFVLVLLFVALSTFAYSDESELPMLPSFFYGDATVNDRDVPVGSVIIAKIDGETRGQTTVDVAGEYGDATGSTDDLRVTGSQSDIGKEINFFLKMPGVLEMTTNQTAEWQSSVETNLDLSFAGAEVAEPEDPVTPGTPPSAGGGGGGGGGGAADDDEDDISSAHYFALIEAGKQVRVSIKNPEIPIILLQLIVNNNVEGANFDFGVVGAPNDLLSDVYKYVSIEAPEVTQDNVKTAIIRFKVANSWFEENNYDPGEVKLYRFHNGQWVPLTTIHEGGDANNHQYRAQTPGFSYFAIKSEKAADSASGESENTESSEGSEETSGDDDSASEEKDLNNSSASPITGFVAGELNKGSPALGIGLMVIIVTIGLLGFLYYKGVIFRNKKQGGK
ncbi:MAG: PGF-pre-PGF domain-containing protein [bacterium]|nr:PGF-pre-PGF domain-containing protein [bacterium]